VIVLNIVLLLGFYRSGSWIFDPNGAPILTDFTPMWLAGREALAGHAAAAYDSRHFSDVQTALVGPHAGQYPWPYPPIFFLPAAVVALLPYGWAFVAWQAATLAGCLAAGYRILRDGLTPLAILAAPLSLLNIYVGQNGFLTAALIGAGLAFLERGPVIAGACFGCLFYKSQFLLLFPLLLAIAGYWRALAAMIAAGALLAIASSLAFGVEPWLAFPAALTERAQAALVVQDLAWGKLQSVYGLARALGLGALPAGIVHAILALLAAALACLIWQRPVSFDVKAAAAASAALIVTPYLFAYDMAAIVIPGAFLVKDLIERGGTRREHAAIFGLFCGLFAMFAGAGIVPLGAIVNLLLFSLIARRAFRGPAPSPAV
jgi:arabinofuranan 3-O-arabinosyltransferase